MNRMSQSDISSQITSVATIASLANDVEAVRLFLLPLETAGTTTISHAYLL